MSRPSAVAHQSESTSDNVSPPSDMDVRAALEQIAQSSQFRSSPRLVAFLRYVVERTLAGRCAEIKSYTIAVDALHRDPSFDPQADPIVRVEAGRLAWGIRERSDQLRQRRA